jgi:hypothetical protein
MWEQKGEWEGRRPKSDYYSDMSALPILTSGPMVPALLIEALLCRIAT